LNATFLLIDDKKGRQMAEANNINCIGTLAVLISAKHKNLISEIKPYFEMLLSKKRFYKKDTLNQILATEDEPLL
jgi:predicted nucleic acid-binding protein